MAVMISKDHLETLSFKFSITLCYIVLPFLKPICCVTSDLWNWIISDAFKKIKPLKSYAPPNEKDLGDGYELAKPIPGESEGPMAPKPSPKPRAAKVPLESSLFTKNEMAKKKNDPSPSSDQSIQKETLEQTNTKRVSKKVVEIEYEVASSIRSTYPESSQLKSSFPSVHNESHSSITANSKKIPVTPTPAYSSKPSGSPLKTISRPADSSPMGQPQKDFGYNKSATPSPGTEATYEEPWDLKMKRLKQEQEKKDKELRKKSDSSPVLKKAVSLYEDAPEYPTQQNKMELNLMSARSISQTSEADVFFEASDLLPTQKVRILWGTGGLLVHIISIAIYAFISKLIN